MVAALVRFTGIVFFMYLGGNLGKAMEVEYGVDPTIVMVLFVGSFISLLFLSVYEGEKSVCLNKK